MSKIVFKATRKLHDSGHRSLDKSGDLQYDMDSRADDGVWIMVSKPSRVFVHCDRSGNYELVFDGDSVELEKQL